MKPLRIIKGTSRTLNVLLKDGNDAPFSLAGVTAIKALFQSTDETELLEITLAASEIAIVGNETRGEISVTLATTDTEDLRAGERLSWEIEIVRSGKTFVTQFPENLDVITRLGPG